MTTRVGMDLLWCVPGVGGSEDYLVRQLHGLSEVPSEFEVTVFAPRGFVAGHPAIAASFRVVEAPSRCTSRIVRVVLQHTWLAFASRGCALVHFGGGTLARTVRRRSVLTIHDIQWVDYPHYVHPLKRWYLRRSVPSSIARATVVAVPSQFVRQTLIADLNADADKVVVVPHGVEQTLASAATSENELRARYALGASRIVVYPATTHPHKNHEFLLRLMSDGVGDWRDPRVHLVVTGSVGRADSSVKALIESTGLSDRVHMLGRVSEHDRDGLIAMAEAVVFPSEYEGFGAPLIEAMAIGTPVVCSDRASLPEVAGDAALVRELTTEAWAHVLTESRSQRGALLERASRRIGLFTAARSAEALVGAYRKALA